MEPFTFKCRPHFILAFTLEALHTNRSCLSLYCCGFFHLFVSLSGSLNTFHPDLFPNGTMAAVAICLAVISFYGVAMSVVLSLLWPSLCSAFRFINPQCSGQLVCKATSHPTQHHGPPISCHIERESLPLPSYSFTAGIKSQQVSQRPPLCLVLSLDLTSVYRRSFQMSNGVSDGACSMLYCRSPGSEWNNCQHTKTGINDVHCTLHRRTIAI